MTLEKLMPTRIPILQRIIQTVAVPVKSLGVGGVGHNAIRTDEGGKWYMQLNPQLAIAFNESADGKVESFTGH